MNKKRLKGKCHQCFGRRLERTDEGYICLDCHYEDKSPLLNGVDTCGLKYTKKEVEQAINTAKGCKCAKRKEYIVYNLSLWRVKISSFKYGSKWDIRLSIRLGKEW